MVQLSLLLLFPSGLKVLALVHATKDYKYIFDATP